ncbi:hypothetical protein HY045_03940 [Candidatus Woesebacteria bacterium]|nr:hypothetical protein [Candidatus Woesebacteria bacterium]
MVKPHYDLEKIKFVVDEATFKKATDLYESGKVTAFKDNGFTYTATVLGTQPYQVIVSNKHFYEGNCECYLGQNDTLCKHMIAVAIYGVARGEKLDEEDKRQITKPASSGILGELKKEDLSSIKKEMSHAVSFVKYYSGPSRTWFAYQNSLTEGCNRLSTIVTKMPIGGETANLLIDLLLRLDKRLQSGVDDSDGTVGSFIEETVEVLKEYTRLDQNLTKCFKKLVGIQTCFGWEESLVKMLSSDNENKL